MIYALPLGGRGGGKEGKGRKTAGHVDLTRIFNFLLSRIVNVYSDPQPIVRPVNYLSWSPATKGQFAASYCFPEFDPKPAGLNPWSYIWDIGTGMSLSRVIARSSCAFCRKHRNREREREPLSSRDKLREIYPRYREMILPFYHVIYYYYCYCS